MKISKIILVAFLSIVFASCATFTRTEKKQIMHFIFQQESDKIHDLTDSIKKLNKANFWEISGLEDSINNLTNEKNELQQSLSNKNSWTTQIDHLNGEIERLNRENNELQIKLTAKNNREIQNTQPAFRKEISEVGVLVLQLDPQESAQKDFDTTKRKIEGISKNSLSHEEKNFLDIAIRMYNLLYRQFVLNN